MAFYRGPRIVTNGLVLALDAANPKSYAYGSTIWNDLSGNLNSGSLINTPALNNDAVGSLVFNGVDNYVVTSTNLTLSSATLICWIKRNGNQDQYDGILFSRTPSLATGLNFYTSNQLGYHWNDTITTYNWASGLTIPNNTWCMVAVTISPTAGVAYLGQSGELLSSTNTTTHNPASSLVFNLSTDPGLGRFFNGSVSNVQVYNRALSAAEIAQNYNAISSRFQYPLTNISTYLTLTQAAGLSIYDDTIENTTYLTRYSSYASASAFALVNEPVI
jgi:hypothetical protein